MENLEDIDKFLDIFDLPKLSQENVNSLNMSISLIETKAVIKCPSTQKGQDFTDSLPNQTNLKRIVNNNILQNVA